MAIVNVEQVWYPSKDGTKISMFLVRTKGLNPTGDSPTLLVGYGAFKVSMLPAFSATLFQWLESGGILAVPNLRGGGEYGEEWHRAGILDKKQRVFDDFIGAAEWLIANKHTNPQKLAIYGSSNGGLLTAAAITQRPELFRAALVLDPLVDMLRYDRFPIAQHWLSEYGSAQNAAQFPSLVAYSPYQRVRPGTKYPAVLLMASEHSTDVRAFHARKMAAALQAATSSDQGERPVVIQINRVGGLSSEGVRELQLRDLVDQRLFVMWQLGMLR
jgi:prolyl oligopeptidase